MRTKQLGYTVIATFLILLLCAPVVADEDEYQLDVTVDFTRVDKDQACVPVTLKVSQDEHLLRMLSWDRDRIYRDIEGKGFEQAVDGDNEQQRWVVPESGGELEYCVVMNHRRSEETGYDSRLRRNWAIFRGDDLVPAAKARSRKGAESNTRLHFKLPKEWAAATRYPTEDNVTYEINNPDRRFDRPTGWMTAGEIGRRKDRIGDTRVVVAGPVDQGLERLEILVLLGYTLESVREYYPDFPERLAIIGAGGDMWLGALSGPGSLFIHADRPLISGNATSTLLHELGHIGLGRKGVRGADWIVEGLVEFLSAHILHTTGGLSNGRYKRVMRDLKEWSEEADHLDESISKGAVTALAVTVFSDLHEELGEDDFKKLVNRLGERDDAVDLEELRETAEELLGGPAKSLSGLPLNHQDDDQSDDDESNGESN